MIAWFWFVFFFKQKTAYEMRISDWSSDVCSSDLFEQEAEFTGPLKAHLWVASATTDMDLFVSLRMYAPDGEEVVFTGASDLAPVARGWQIGRASCRERVCQYV